MTEDQLNGLVTFHGHKDIAYSISAEEVLEIYVSGHKQKLCLALFTLNALHK